MDRITGSELTINDDDEPTVVSETTVIVTDSMIVADEGWFEEKTQQLDFDEAMLSAEAKLVIGYLTMEQNGMFGGLSVEEQQRVAERLKR